MNFLEPALWRRWGRESLRVNRLDAPIPGPSMRVAFWLMVDRLLQVHGHRDRVDLFERLVPRMAEIGPWVAERVKTSDGSALWYGPGGFFLAIMPDGRVLYTNKGSVACTYGPGARDRVYTPIYQEFVELCRS